MQLLLDVGNTYCKSAVLTDGTITRCQSILIQDDPKRCLVRESLEDIDAVWVVSVRGDTFNGHLTQAIQQKFSIEPEFAQVYRSACGVTTQYAMSLGADRFMALIAAWQTLATTCIVIDCGTAVTIDALDQNGTHLGGLIMPGLDMLQSSLYRNTDNLHSHTGANKTLLAQNTNDAIHSGCCLMWEAGIQKASVAMASELGKNVFICTGGNSERLLSVWQDVQHVPDLILTGLVAYMQAKPHQEPSADAG